MTQGTSPFVLGLTGSIGMGKTTTADMFRDAGIPVWDADDAVSRLYAPGGEGVAAIGCLVPAAVAHGMVDKEALRQAIAADPALLSSIEAVMHPLVAADRAAFLEQARNSAAAVVVLDTPLLFETGAAQTVDAVAVVSTTPEEQRRRVLARPGMTEERFQMLLGRQVPDAEKRARADFVIDTANHDTARRAVAHILETLESRTNA